MKSQVATALQRILSIAIALALAKSLVDSSVRPSALAISFRPLPLLARVRSLPRFLTGPGLAVAFEPLGLQVVFFAAGFLAGAFLAALRPPFFFAGGPLAARASIRATACSAVTSSGFTSLGSVALVVPSVT